jgi:hypothetical protein
VEGVEDKWARLDKPLKGQNKEQVIKILGRNRKILPEIYD